MLDRFDEALPLAYESNERQRELDGRLIGESRLGYIARMAGDHATATTHFENLCAWLEEREQHGLLATYVGELGQELCALGRFDEAAEKARIGRELADHTDLVPTNYGGWCKRASSHTGASTKRRNA